MTLVKYCDGTYTTYVILTKTLVFGAFYGPLAIVLTFFHCQKKSNRTKIMVFSYHLKSAAKIRIWHSAVSKAQGESYISNL